MEEQHVAEISAAFAPYLINILWGALFSVVIYWVKGVSNKLDKLIVHKEGCITMFAEREANSKEHGEIKGEIRDHEKRITSVETKVDLMKEGR